MNESSIVTSPTLLPQLLSDDDDADDGGSMEDLELGENFTGHSFDPVTQFAQSAITEAIVQEKSMLNEEKRQKKALFDAEV